MSASRKPPSKPTSRCPVCRKNVDDVTDRPFCSSRCRLIDLGRWLGDGYAIAGEDAPLIPDGEA